MIYGVFLLLFNQQINLNCVWFRGMNIFLLFLCTCSGKTATTLFSSSTTNTNSIAAVTPEKGENQIFFYISVINSLEVNKSFEESNVSFQEVLIVPKWANLTNGHEEKSEIITILSYKRKLQQNQVIKNKTSNNQIKRKQKKNKLEIKTTSKSKETKKTCVKKKRMRCWQKIMVLHCL